MAVTDRSDADRRARRAALAATLALAALIASSTAADPSGLLALVGWKGTRPVPALWWWAPYLVYLPALLAANYLAVRTILAATLARAGRFGVLLQLWWIAVLATAVSAFLCSLASVAPERIAGRFVLPVAETLAFLLWSSGYAAFKMLLVGWVPAVAGVCIWAPRRAAGVGSTPDSPLPPAARGGIARLIAGGGTLAIAALGPWLALHWWQGSPVGFIYGQDALPFSPTPASPAWEYACALGICGLAALLAASQSLKRLRGDARAAALFLVGTHAAGAAALSLLVLQTLLSLIAGRAAAASHDDWLLPATFLHAVEAGSFAIVAALPMGLLAVIGHWIVEHRSNGAAGVGAAGVGAASIGAASTGAAEHLRAAGAIRWLERSGLLAGAALCLSVVYSLGFSAASPALDPTDSPISIDAAAALPRLAVWVDAGGPRIADLSGAQVTLRGINVNQLNSYYRADPRLDDVAPLSEQDFADIAALGMNSVRLTLSWSRLEPRRGEISAAYLARIAEAVGWARRHRIYVILDVHQDAWSAAVAAPSGTRCRAGTEPMTGWDGAPAWATYMDDRPPCQITGRDLAPNVSRAFESFYFDREGIQTRLIGAWAALARAFAADPTVAGFDLLNEPNFAESPPLTSTLMLANYYARAIRAIRAAESGTPGGFPHLVFVEPSIIWSGFGFDNLPPRGFAEDRQIVFSPHLYNESITSDQDLGMTLISVERGFALASGAAAQLSAPLWIGEWGAFRDPIAQAPLLARQAQAEDALQVGSAAWVWKQACGDPHVYPGAIAGNTRRRICPANEDIESQPAATLQLRRPYARSAPGRILEFAQDPRRFELIGQLAGEGAALRAPSAAATHCNLELWVPGDERPVLAGSTGVAQIQMTRVEAGSSLLGPSGGWLATGCVIADRYRVTLELERAQTPGNEPQ